MQPLQSAIELKAVRYEFSRAIGRRVVVLVSTLADGVEFARGRNSGSGRYRYSASRSGNRCHFPQHRDSALRAAERCYLQTARDLGGAEKFAQNWVSAVMLRLQAEVEQRVSANRNRLKALHAELVRAESADVQEFREIRQRRWRMRGDRFSRSLVDDVPSAVTMATRELRFSIRAGTVPMFGFMPFPADRFDRQAESRCRPSVNVGPVAHDSKIAAD